MYHPSLRREPRYEPAPVIPVVQDVSILDWLEANGRLLDRADNDDKYNLEEEDAIADEFISGIDEGGYEDIEEEDPFVDLEEDAI